MKRLLCMVLVLMLLCGSAFAEENQAVITFSANETQLIDLLTQMGAPGEVKLLAQGLEELLAKLRLEFQWRDNASWGGVWLADTTVVDMATFQDDEGLIQLTTSLMPEHYIAYQFTEAEMTRNRDAFSTMTSTNWLAVANELAEAAQAWWNELPGQESAGRFIGDAYDGGTRCVTRSFDDEDLACAVDRLSTILQQHGVDNDFLTAYLGLNNLWESVQTANRTAAQNNRYHYTVKQVYDDNGDMRGLSFIVLEGENQLMTASLGMNESGWKLVLGWGKNERNYYLCLETFPTENGTDWMALLYQDPQRLGFSMVETLPSYLLWLAGGELTQQAEDAWRLDMECVDLYADNALLKDFYVRIDASETAQGSVMDASLYLPSVGGESAEEPVFGVNLMIQPADERTWSVEGRQRLDMESADALGEETQTVMEQEVQQSINLLMVQLFKEMPAQLITYVMQYFAD